MTDVVVRLIGEGSDRCYEVELNVSGTRYIGSSPKGAFFALQDVRRKLEPIDVWLDCFGSREDIYPTHMMQNMSPSFIAVRLKMGRQTTLEDVVDIFDTDVDRSPAMVDAQEAYQQAWLRSLKELRADSSN